MDVFQVRDKVIDDYRSFTTAFVDIKDARLKDYYQSELDRDRQWPEPWISLNPAFETGGRIDELVGEGLLNAECDRIFRVVATGDSYNDTGMLTQADAGILFRPPANVVAEFGQFPVV